MGRRAKDVPVEPHGLVEVAHGNSDMGDPRLRGDVRRQHSETF
jgi:hypothetical protein